MVRPVLSCVIAFGLVFCSANALAQANTLTQEGDLALCRDMEFEDVSISMCAFDPAVDDIRLFLNDDDGEPFREFGRLKRAVEADGGALVFAMNAGMYHRDRSPVGHYVEAGQQLRKVNTRSGPGNFHLLPNGVFYLTADGKGGVLESKAYKKAGLDIAYATQSGPMLVINGELHPSLLMDSDSRKRRNGVGVADDGKVIFAISNEPVNFHQFARFFRDEVRAGNALFLDGTISRLYAPELNRADPGVGMGPIVGVVVPQLTDGAPDAPPEVPQN